MRLLCACCLAVLPVTVSAQEPPNTIPNGGMEGDYQQGLPPGWVPNCYGENRETFRADRETPHSGQAALLVECTEFITGGVQFRCGGQSVVQGQPYTLSLWLKGDLQHQVWVGIRKHGEPYTAYLLRYVRVGPEWRRYTIIGESKGTDPECGVYLMFAETGTLTVDDVSLRAGRFPPATAAIDAQPAKGNHVYNSSFEIGTSGWAPLDGGLREAKAPDAPEGAYCAVRRLGGAGLIAESRPMTLKAGQKHTLSAWLKASQPNTKVRLELVEYADAGGDSPTDRDGVRGDVTVGTGWSRQSVTGIIDAPFTDGYMVRLHALTPVPEVSLDAVQVEEGDLADYAPASPVEIALYTSPLGRYPSPGERVTVTARLASSAPLAIDPNLLLSLTDLFGQATPCGSAVARRDDARHASCEATVSASAPGLYRLQAVRARGSAEPQPVAAVAQASLPANPGAGELVLGVLPPASAVKPNAASFFGTHAPPILGPQSLNLGPKIALRSGARWHRIHDFACYVQWHFVEPQPGKWVWADEDVNYLKSLGFELLGTLARTPPWAGKQGPEHTVYGDWTSAPPRDLNEFSEYVRRTVEHYRDRIHVWEIWNEPYGSGFFSGPPEEYAEVLKAGYRACKQADPTCTVLGLSCYPGLPDWIDRVLAAAGTDHMDALSYHTYYSPGHVQEPAIPALGSVGAAREPPAVRARGSAEPQAVSGVAQASLPAVHDVQTLRSLMAKHGTVKPIWNTEGGVACPTFYSWLPPDGWPCTPREAAATYTKCVTLLLAAGVKRWCYYFAGWPGGGRGDYYQLLNTPYVQIDFDGSPKATLLAQSAAAQMLDGAQFVSDCSTRTRRAYLFQRGPDAVAVLWAKGVGAAREPPLLSIPAGVRAFNMMAAPLAANGSVSVTTEPVYVVAPGRTAAQLAEELGLRRA